MVVCDFSTNEIKFKNDLLYALKAMALRDLHAIINICLDYIK